MLELSRWCLLGERIDLGVLGYLIGGSGGRLLASQSTLGTP